jgi:hypothetical protein
MRFVNEARARAQPRRAQPAARRRSAEARLQAGRLSPDAPMLRLSINPSDLFPGKRPWDPSAPLAPNLYVDLESMHMMQVTLPPPPSTNQTLIRPIQTGRTSLPMPALPRIPPTAGGLRLRRARRTTREVRRGRFR